MTQRVLITAGAGGIWLAIAQVFVANGARVHIADVNAEAVRQISRMRCRTGCCSFISSSRSLWHRSGGSYIQDADQARVGDALTQLDELTKEFGGSVECESLVVSGRPADAIALIADQRRAGVIAMGLASSQGRWTRCCGCGRSARWPRECFERPEVQSPEPLFSGRLAYPIVVPKSALTRLAVVSVTLRRLRTERTCPGPYV